MDFGKSQESIQKSQYRQVHCPGVEHLSDKLTLIPDNSQWCHPLAASPRRSGSDEVSSETWAVQQETGWFENITRARDALWPQ
jgi:hypothetical protein